MLRVRGIQADLAPAFEDTPQTGSSPLNVPGILEAGSYDLHLKADKWAAALVRDAMAATSDHPEEPVNLIGISAGAQVAWRAAEMLTSQGRRVNYVITAGGMRYVDFAVEHRNANRTVIIEAARDTGIMHPVGDNGLGVPRNVRFGPGEDPCQLIAMRGACGSFGQNGRYLWLDDVDHMDLFDMTIPNRHYPVMAAIADYLVAIGITER
jgi:hypothetical protein